MYMYVYIYIYIYIYKTCVCVCVWIYMYKHTHVYDKWLWMKACTGCSGPARERVGCMHVLHIDASKKDSHTERAC